MIKTPFLVERASNETVQALIKLGYLVVREDGLHVNEEIPTTTAKSE